MLLINGSFRFFIWFMYSSFSVDGGINFGHLGGNGGHFAGRNILKFLICK